MKVRGICQGPRFKEERVRGPLIVVHKIGWWEEQRVWENSGPGLISGRSVTEQRLVSGTSGRAARVMVSGRVMETCGISGISGNVSFERDNGAMDKMIFFCVGS